MSLTRPSFSPLNLLATALIPALLVTAVTATATSAAASGSPQPHIKGNATIAAYSYANAIRESVWIEVPIDSDHDGQNDRTVADIVRPREAAQAGVRVPAIVEASPYYTSWYGRGNEQEMKTYNPDGTVAKIPLFYDNYFVPRGYAFVAVDLSGTNRSTGCEDIGGPAELASAKAVIDWLNGRARGYHADGSVATADWTTGDAGMIGKSWDGTIANAVAATGVEGLKTIVPISAISSWYGYTRFHGLLRKPDFPAFMSIAVGSRPAEACGATWAALRADSAEDTGDFNAFWQERDYLYNIDKVRAGVFAIDGVNDLNVHTWHYLRWWKGLTEQNVPRKLWLHQTGHEDPFDVRRAAWVPTLHRWFDYWLQGLDNGIMKEPQVSRETGPGVWQDEPAWPAPDGHPVRMALGAGDGTTGTLGGHRAKPGTVWSYRDESLAENVLVAEPNVAREGRLVFLSGALTRPLRISGAPSAQLRIKVDRPTTELTARLVDYGTAERIDYRNSEGVGTLTTESCWGESTATDDACYYDTAENLVTSDHDVLTRGWLDAAHHLSLRFTSALEPDRWYTVTIPLNAYETTLPAGHVLGLVLGQSDPGFTVVNDRDAVVQVDLAASTLTLPIAGEGELPSVTTAPAVKAKVAGPVRQSPEADDLP